MGRQLDGRDIVARRRYGIAVHRESSMARNCASSFDRTRPYSLSLFPNQFTYCVL